jgi:hypothetical protein
VNLQGVEVQINLVSNLVVAFESAIPYHDLSILDVS